MCPVCQEYTHRGNTAQICMVLIGWYMSGARACLFLGLSWHNITQRNMVCALKKHTVGIHQGMKSNFVRGNLMPTPLYNDWRKLIITNNIPVSAIQELFNRIFIIHVSWYTSTSPFCNISEINSISSSCRLSSRLPVQQFILKTNTFSKQMARNVEERLQCPHKQNWCLKIG